MLVNMIKDSMDPLHKCVCVWPSHISHSYSATLQNIQQDQQDQQDQQVEISEISTLCNHFHMKTSAAGCLAWSTIPELLGRGWAVQCAAFWSRVTCAVGSGRFSSFHFSLEIVIHWVFKFSCLHLSLQGLLSKEGSTHIGIRATTYSAEDFHDSDAMGIATLTAED